jgi:hypothetical protein
MRTDPSAPTDAKTSVPRANAMSYTSLSCAISCVFACCVCFDNISVYARYVTGVRHVCNKGGGGRGS